MANSKRHPRVLGGDWVGSWAAAIVSSLARPEPPAGALTTDQLYALSDKRISRNRFRELLKERKDLQSVLFASGRNQTRFWWPANP